MHTYYISVIIRDRCMFPLFIARTLVFPQIIHNHQKLTRRGGGDKGE
jgi:hypothetical protein